MEPFFADFLLNKKIPKAIRYLALAVPVGFIVFLCVYFGIVNDSAAGAAACFVIAALMLVLGAWAAVRIHKS